MIRSRRLRLRRFFLGFPLLLAGQHVKAMCDFFFVAPSSKRTSHLAIGDDIFFSKWPFPPICQQIHLPRFIKLVSFATNLCSSFLAVQEHLVEVHHEIDCTRIAMNPKFKGLEVQFGIPTGSGRNGKVLLMKKPIVSSLEHLYCSKAMVEHQTNICLKRQNHFPT